MLLTERSEESCATQQVMSDEKRILAAGKLYCIKIKARTVWSVCAFIFVKVLLVE